MNYVNNNGRDVKIVNRVSLQQCRKLLPKFACGLGIYARSVEHLRTMVIDDLEAYSENANPLTPAQAKQLRNFLKKTGDAR